MASTEKAELFWRSVAFSFAVGFQHMKIPISRNLRATEIGRIIRMRSDAKKLQADIAMLWEQEVRGPYKPRIKKDDISFFANVVFDYYLLAL